MKVLSKTILITIIFSIFSFYGYAAEEKKNLTTLYAQIREKYKEDEPTTTPKSQSFLKENQTNFWEQLMAEPEVPAEDSYLKKHLNALQNWDRTKEADIKKLRADNNRKEKDERGLELPLHSNLQIDGYKSIRVEYNHTHYFGREDINRFYGGYSGGSSYNSGLNLGGYSSYDSYDYQDYGGYGGSYSGYGGYGGGYRGAGPSGVNIEQELKVGLHGRIGKHTHVSVDYSDIGGGNYGGYGGLDNKEQKIRVWYEGDEGDFIRRISFGDIMLSLPNARFLSVNRNLFGLEMQAQLKGIRLTAFGSKSKGIKEKKKFRGESRRAGYGTGNRITDYNYKKETYYAIYSEYQTIGGEEPSVVYHEERLPIVTGSEVIYVDDGDGGNNQGGVNTARGYFNQLFPGQDYNIDYNTGEIEFLIQISSKYKIVVAYEYSGDGGGNVGVPEDVFADDNGNDIIDEEDDPSEKLGYVVIKETNLHGTELRNVYSLGNRNIRRQDFELSIWRQGGTDFFEIDGNRIPYIQIFGLDTDKDGIVDPDFIDFERGLLTFPTPHPFMIEEPDSEYYEYREDLNNEAIYAENPRYADTIYTIQADYSYQSDTYNVGLFVIPRSETVWLNKRKLQRDVDYMMIYEVGTLNLFTELDEFDEIEIEYEKTPFGGSLQQTVAGIWAEYSYKPRSERPPSRSEKIELAQQSQGTSDIGSRTRVFGDDSGYSSYDGYGSGYSSYGSSYGGASSYGGYGGGSSGYSYKGSGRRFYGGSSTSFNPTFSKGFNIAVGYIYNTGSRTSRIPTVNEVPARLQAFDINTSFGKTFNLARILNPLPLINANQIPLTIDFSGESAYSRNNPNSVGFALIDSMEGAKETSSMPTFKYNWKTCSLPLDAEYVKPENRAIFSIIKKDEDAADGNYMKNKEVPASTINPMARATEEQLVMEIGYDFKDGVETWGGLSHSISGTGADYTDKDFLEIWLRQKGADAVTLHIDIGVISEDADDDKILDSEDLPRNLTDENGDNKMDILDISLDDLAKEKEHKYKANGSLDTGEDVGFLYNGPAEEVTIGADNKVLDTEDLDGNNMLDTVDSYFELSIPLNDIPEEWMKRETDNGWHFLSIPFSAFTVHGRPPSLVFVKHSRLWLEKNEPGTVVGTLEWASIEATGNQWERGVVANAETGAITTTDEEFLVGTKDNHDFEEYLDAYKIIEANEDFSKLHPYVESGFGFQEQQQREQSLTLTYTLQQGSIGFTSKTLKGARAGDGQDFSKHNTLRFWLYNPPGNPEGATFVMRLASSIQTQSYYNPYSYYDRDKKPEEEPSIFAKGVKDYYLYHQTLDFNGWKLVEITLMDEDSNGHPDGFEIEGDETKLSMRNVGGILLGVQNDTGGDVNGEVWVNEIHLINPLVRSGWAGRGNFSFGLGNILNVRGGYTKQDKDFENSAGQTGRRSRMDAGYSTSTNDANIDAELKIFQWLPVRYSIRSQESETESRRGYGYISSYNSGRNELRNDNVGIKFTLRRFPTLSFDYDKQNHWNERRGTEISNLYSYSFGYDIKNKISLDTEYRHEYSTLDPTTADTDTTGSSGYSSYYSRSGDEIIDSGMISLRISPFSSFSLNPTYDVRRELEKRQSSSGYGEPEEEEEEAKFVLASREHRVSLRPQINRSLFGIRPSITTRGSFRENWWSGQKDASINANVSLGLNLRAKEWFQRKAKKVERKDESQYSEVKPPNEQGTPVDAEKEESDKTKELLEDTKGQGSERSPSRSEPEPGEKTEQKSDKLNPVQPEQEDSTPQPQSDERRNKLETIKDIVGSDSFEEALRESELEERELERLKRFGVSEEEIEEMQDSRSDWINRDKAELDRKIREREARGEEVQKAGILRRSIESFSVNVDTSFDIRNYLRRLDSGDNFLDILKLPDDSEKRSRSTEGNRYGSRLSFDPFTWASLGGSYRYDNNFTKSAGTTSRYKSNSYESNTKFFNSKNSSSFQLRYEMRTSNRTNAAGKNISDSKSHTSSLSWSQNWRGGTRTSLGTRLSFGEREHSGVESSNLRITPSFSIDYNLKFEGEWRIPILHKSIKLPQTLAVTNTFSTAILRQKLGVNRDEKSERYETTLRVNYKLSTRLSMNLNLHVSYNNDRVEEGRDYFSIGSSVMVRGEFR